MDLWIVAELATVIIVIVAVLARRQRQAERAFFITCFSFHKVIVDRVCARRPELSAEQMNMVMDALRDYFLINLRAGKKMVAMPSQVVDDLWHEFILYTKPYKAFCDKAFGRFLHHTPSEGMSSPTVAQDGIKRAWLYACKHEGIDPQNPDRLPRIFAVDAVLNIKDGYHYTLNCQNNDLKQAGGIAPYCASHIGCGSGCSSDSDNDNDGGSSCGSGCGGD